MASAPLQLELYRLEKVVAEFDDRWFAVDEAEAEETPEYVVNSDYDLYSHDEREDAYMVRLVVECKPPEERILRFKQISVAVWGIFTVSEDVEEDVVARLVPCNCLAILHGTARGIVLNATGSCPGGPFLLPTVNYIEIVQQKAEERADSEDEPEGEPAQDASQTAETSSAEDEA